MPEISTSELWELIKKLSGEVERMKERVSKLERYHDLD